WTSPLCFEFWIRIGGKFQIKEFQQGKEKKEYLNAKKSDLWGRGDKETSGSFLKISLRPIQKPKRRFLVLQIAGAA
ncbi:MAG: hypothetical protein ACE5GQ_10135, partial [Nitrospinales bacterium]